MSPKDPRSVLAIHGGAGTILRDKMTPEKEARCSDSLTRALEGGAAALAAGGTAIDAVEKAVQIMEDDPLFNAGHGSVFSGHGHHELDAAVMCGRTLNAGAVAALQHVRNPIQLARKVLEDADFVLLTGHGAEEYALECGVPFVPNRYFSTERRRSQLDAARKADVVALDHDGGDEFGTVGAVALDESGDLAAATSTGGLTNKAFGRVGDSPLIGCGTYANNATCAVSCTGKGESFIRHVVAHDLHCLMAYRGFDLATACRTILNGFAEHQCTGGWIALDRDGNIEMPFNTQGMFRGWIRLVDRVPSVGIYCRE